MKTFDLIIIGCGATAASFLYQLNEMLNIKKIGTYSVAVVESNKDFSSGYAYKDEDPCLLLNTRIEEMNISLSSQDSFKFWLESQGFNKNLKNIFLPRYFFKKYIKSQFEKCITETSIELTLINEEGVDCERNDCLFKIITKNQVLIGHKVIFSLGGSFQPFSYSMTENENYIQDIYQNETINNIPYGSSVLILGSGLTMVDACIKLSQLNKDIQMTVASRSGYLPGLKMSSLDIKYGNNLIKKIKRFLEKNEEITEFEIISFINKNLTEYFKRQFSIMEVISKYQEDINNTGRNLSDSDSFNFSSLGPYIDECINLSWKRLKHKESINKISKYLLRYICGIPDENFEKIKKISKKKALEIKRLHSIRSSHNKFTAKFLMEEEIEYNFDYSINCTGLTGYFHPENKSELAKNIRKRSEFMINEEYGLMIDEKNRIVSCNNKILNNAYAIGMAAVGSNFIRSSFSYYSKENEKLVNYIVQKIENITTAK